MSVAEIVDDVLVLDDLEAAETDVVQCRSLVVIRDRIALRWGGSGLSRPGHSDGDRPGETSERTTSYQAARS